MNDILTYLGCQAEPPTLKSLNRLIHAYYRTVPWESVSRIIKRRKTLNTSDCPRWPEEFWQDAIQYSFGGTCFESSLAFFSLLSSLGYEGYLTVNDMGESHACHAAIVIIIDGLKYLVDITISVHSAVHFDSQKNTQQVSYFHDYTIRPVGENTYEIERSHHPHRYTFTLIDYPVELPKYYSIVENDYAQTGLFLKSVAMTKIIGDQVWRFHSDNEPYKLESFDRHGKYETLLSPEAMARTLAEKFHMPEEKISTAFFGI